MTGQQTVRRRRNELKEIAEIEHRFPRRKEKDKNG